MSWKSPAIRTIPNILSVPSDQDSNTLSTVTEYFDILQASLLARPDLEIKWVQEEMW